MHRSTSENVAVIELEVLENNSQGHLYIARSSRSSVHSRFISQERLRNFRGFLQMDAAVASVIIAIAKIFEPCKASVGTDWLLKCSGGT